MDETKVLPNNNALVTSNEDGIDVGGFESSSGATPHYQLPLIVGDNKFSFLEDWNNTMQTVDEALYKNATDGQATDEAVKQLTTDNERQDQEITAIRQVDEKQSQDIQTNSENISEIQNDVNTVKNDLIQQNAMVKRHDNEIAGLQTDNEDNKQSVAYVQQQVSGLTNTVENHWSSTTSQSDTGIMSNKQITDELTNEDSTLLQRVDDSEEKASNALTQAQQANQLSNSLDVEFRDFKGKMLDGSVFSTGILLDNDTPSISYSYYTTSKATSARTACICFANVYGSNGSPSVPKSSFISSVALLRSGNSRNISSNGVTVSFTLDPAAQSLTVDMDLETGITRRFVEFGFIVIPSIIAPN